VFTKGDFEPCCLVGAPRFELGTSRTRTVRASRTALRPERHDYNLANLLWQGRWLTVQIMRINLEVFNRYIQFYKKNDII
jgi:hypothetical protein